MSGSLSNVERQELRELIHALRDGCITAEEAARLESWVCENEEARWIYVQYMNLCGILSWEGVAESELGQTTSKANDNSKANDKTRRSPVLGFLGDVCREGRDFLSRSSVLSLLMAIGLPGLVLVFLFLIIARQPDEPRGHTAANAAVARITGLHQAMWQEGDAVLAVGARLNCAQRLCLQTGLAEISFADGAKVVVEGPATFRADSSGRGFLEAGRLVAHVPKGAEGFTVETPAATIVDLGTEFGVSVEKAKGTAEVEVFQGTVALNAGASETRETPSSRRVEAGQAVRIAPVGPKGQFVVRETSLPANRFVRRLPPPITQPSKAKETPKPKPPIFAEFSGGNGSARVDQFVGKSGEGWADSWRILNHGSVQGGGVCKFKPMVTVEDKKPLQGAGKYLRYLVVRGTGDTWGGATMFRPFKSTRSVSLAKPYFVFLNLRVDEAVAFDDRLDGITISGDSKPRSISTSKSTGWAIRVAGRDEPGERIAPRHWRFLAGDGKGDYRQVDSGIRMEIGRVYSFRIVVDPQKKTWTASIGVDGKKPKTFPPMRIRSAESAKKSNYWSYLTFQWQMKGGGKGEERERIGFSIDSIGIGQTE